MRSGRFSTLAILSILISVISFTALHAAPSKKSMLEQLELPLYPGAKTLREINWPSGKVLDDLAKEFGPLFGLKELKQVSIVMTRVDATSEPEQILKFYEPAITSQEWKTMDKSLARDEASAILFHENKGILIIFVGPRVGKNRDVNITRLFGTMDPSKIGNTQGKIPEMLKKMSPEEQGEEPAIEVTSRSRIPAGQPISVPPSEKVHIKSIRSDLNVLLVEGNTVEIRVLGSTDDIGELSRIDERLVLNLAARLAVDRISVPAGIPTLFEPTEGSITIAPSKPVRPARLSVVSIGAPIALKDFPLVGGVHMLKSTGAEIAISFSRVETGEMVVGATGDDITIELPKNASAEITAQATKGSVQNLTSIKPEIEDKDRLKLILGSGKAKISLEAVNGAIYIKTTD